MKENLVALKLSLQQLSSEEEKMRNIYLRDLALGKRLGPATGFSSIDKSWLQYYSEDAVKMDCPSMTAYQYLKTNIKNLDSIAINYFGKKISFKQLFEHIDDVEQKFLNIGIREDDIVSMMVTQTPEFIYSFYALNKIGAVAHMIDPRVGSEQLQQYLSEIQPKQFILFDSFYQGEIQKTLESSDVGTIIKLSPFLSLPASKKMMINVIKLLKKSKAMEPSIKETLLFEKMKHNHDKLNSYIYEKNKPAVIVSTGGTTGYPKGVVLSNENLNGMVFQHQISNMGLDTNDRFLNTIVPFVAYGLCNAMHMPFCLEMESVLIPDFDPAKLGKLISEYQPSHLLGVPAHLQAALSSEELKKGKMSCFKTIALGGDALPQSQEETFNNLLEEKGAVISVSKGYGMTEVGSCATFTLNCTNLPNSVGIPLPKNLVSCFDSETLEEVQTGELGEICISGPTVMLGYYNNQAETAHLLRKHDDGHIWAHTGDLGYMDQNGNLYVTGRLKRMIVRCGYKVFPLPIEDTILRHPAVAECSVVGMVHPIDVNVPIAHIVLKPNYVGMESKVQEQLVLLCEKELQEHFQPFSYRFKDNLPHTAIGKIDYRLLEQEDVSDILNKIPKIATKVKI